jgi:hypothetical protein
MRGRELRMPPLDSSSLVEFGGAIIFALGQNVLRDQNILMAAPSKM